MSTAAPTLGTVDAALAQLRRGRPVLVVDDADRENEGDVVLAAQLASAAWVGWTVRHTSGVLCAPPRVRPRPFELILESPQAAPAFLKETAFVAALQTILLRYREFIAFAPNL